MDIMKKAEKIAAAAKASCSELSQASSGMKNDALLYAAEMMKKRKGQLKEANAKDLKDGKKNGLSPAMLDRLKIDDKRIEQMCEGLSQVAALPDPVGETITGWKRPNGLNLRKVRVPLGVIFMIYESRPNVTIDAGSLALKSGNVVILRGGKEAINSNLALGKIFSEAVKKAGLPKDAVQIIDTPDRELATALMKQNKNIDVVIPRGGKGLISTVYRESLIPVIAHLDGICHLYVDQSADIDMAAEIAVNAKAQRPGVCNAIETLLVHKKAAAKFLPIGLKALRKAKVKLKCCNATKKYAKGIKVEQATEEDWATEYLDYILSVKIVSDINEAIEHINHYGSHHTDAIITGCVNAAEKFRSGVDSSSVMVNASTRFSDGFEYGLGAEMGISTNKLHARGPVGLEELTTYKFLVDGNGQIRT